MKQSDPHFLVAVAKRAHLPVFTCPSFLPVQTVFALITVRVVKLFDLVVGRLARLVFTGLEELALILGVIDVVGVAAPIVIVMEEPACMELRSALVLKGALLGLEGGEVKAEEEGRWEARVVSIAVDGEAVRSIGAVFVQTVVGLVDEWVVVVLKSVVVRGAALIPTAFPRLTPATQLVGIVDEASLGVGTAPLIIETVIARAGVFVVLFFGVAGVHLEGLQAIVDSPTVLGVGIFWNFLLFDHCAQLQ